MALNQSVPKHSEISDWIAQQFLAWISGTAASEQVPVLRLNWNHKFLFAALTQYFDCDPVARTVVIEGMSKELKDKT